MFNKKMKLFLVTLVFMLSISAVSAAEANNTDDLGIGDVDEEPPSGAIQSVSINETNGSNNDVLAVNNANTSNEVISASIGSYSMNGKDVTLYYNNGTSYVVTLLKSGKALKNTELSVVINGVTYTKTTDSSGKVSIPITLKEGNYVATATFCRLFIKNNIKVLPVVLGGDVSKHFSSSTYYSATFLNDKGKALTNTAVQFKVNGKTYKSKTNSKGVAVLKENLTGGVYTVNAIHPNGFTVSNRLTVISSVNSSDLTKGYRSSENFEATFYDKNGKVLANKNIQYCFNNHLYFTVKTDANGVAKLAITATVGTHTITSINPVTGERVTNKVNVLDTITSSDLTKRYRSSYNFEAKFYDLNGKPLSNTQVNFLFNNRLSLTAKTNANGVASVPITATVGTHSITSINPVSGQQKTNSIKVIDSLVASDLTKRYRSSLNFNVTFYDANEKLLANTNVNFLFNNRLSLTAKTNANGVASVPITATVGTHTITSINPKTGQSIVNKITVLPTLSVKENVTTFENTNTNFKVTLYKGEGFVKNSIVFIYVNGVKNAVRTDAKGVATYTFKLSKGTYEFITQDPYTTYSQKTTVYVKAATIKASDMQAVENQVSTFTATLLKEDGSVSPKTKMKISIDGKTSTVKTNSKGVASLKFNLTKGTHTVVCKDLSNGYTLTTKIVVTGSTKYNQYGVSSDGKTILAIGRASASGELSKYGYTFYATEFERTCSCCGGHNLYWSIFWAGSETANYGVFPATGNKEGSSAEGAIFCADCDSDWSVFGHNHGGSGGDLTVVTKTTASSKAAAYELKSGNYVSS